MGSRPCLLRLQKEYVRLGADPLPDIAAHPRFEHRVILPMDLVLLTLTHCPDRPQNMLEWHFVIKGPKETPYAGGRYHGKLVFPADYPYKPPAIMMLTPK